MKSHNLPGIIKTELLFKATIIILCLSVSGWIGFAQKKTGKFFDCNSPNVELNRLQTMIKTGSNEFHRSYSDALKVMAEYEKAAKQAVKFNFSLARSKNESAILKLENTKNIFKKVVRLCSQRDFRSTIKETLLSSDYLKAQFKVSKEKTPLKEAFQYLKDGDILRFYQQKIELTDELINIMKQIKRDLEMDIEPEVSIFWKLLQRYSFLSLIESKSIISLRMETIKNVNKKGGVK